MKKIILLFGAIFMISACSEIELGSHVAKQMVFPSDDTKHIGSFKTGNPYKIKGRTYRPAEKYQFSETGIASWYGPGFHGKQTANGEIFNKYDLTAAHRTLQMPSIVRVTNLKNGKSIIVRVNDRGPFAHDRIIDLSERSAELLGMKHQGTAKVRVDVLEKESRIVATAAKNGISTRGTEVALNRGQPIEGMALAVATPTAKPMSSRYNLGTTTPTTVVDNQSFSPKTKMFNQVLADQAASPQPITKPNHIASSAGTATKDYYIQAGAFKNEDNAMTMKSALYNIQQPVNVVSAVESDNLIYRVKIGPVSGVEKANEILTLLNKQGRDARLIVAQN